MELTFLILLITLIIIPIIMIIIGSTHIFFSKLQLSKRDKIRSKFNDYLIEQCKKENIKIELFNTIEELNKNEPNRSTWAAGIYRFKKQFVYSYMSKLKQLPKYDKLFKDISHYSLDRQLEILKDHNKSLDYNSNIIKEYENKLIKQLPDEIIYDTSNSTIQLLKDYNIFTLAHELGHHFSIKNNKDNSEKSADNYINILANECLTYLERYCLSISLSVYSGIDIKYNNFKVLKEYLKNKFGY